MERFFCDIRTVSPEEYKEAFSRMSEERKTRCLALRKAEDQKRCIAADHMLRSLLSPRTGIPEERLRFEREEWGKPVLSGSEWHFSVSHSGNWVACALNRTPVGIDIETIRPLSLGIEKKVCCPAEIEYLEASPDPETRLTRFFELWTRKEALFKFWGTGLHAEWKTDVLNPPDSLRIITEHYKETVCSTVFEAKSKDCPSLTRDTEKTTSNFTANADSDTNVRLKNRNSRFTSCTFSVQNTILIP